MDQDGSSGSDKKHSESEYIFQVKPDIMGYERKDIMDDSKVFILSKCENGVATY